MIGDEGKLEANHRFCPYCDEAVAEISWPHCHTCEVTVFYCPKCRKPVPRDNKICPDCGAEIKG